MKRIHNLKLSDIHPRHGTLTAVAVKRIPGPRFVNTWVIAQCDCGVKTKIQPSEWRKKSTKTCGDCARRHIATTVPPKIRALGTWIR